MSDNDDACGATTATMGSAVAPAAATPAVPSIAPAERATVGGLSFVRTALSRLPAESGGIALNLAGMGSWLSAMCELHPTLLPVYNPGSVVVVSLACTIFVAIFLQALLHNAHFRGELKKPKQCGSLGGCLMGFTLCCSYTRFLPAVVLAHGRLPFALVHAAGSLQLAMLAWYFFWTHKQRSPPVPYWFPATVGIGMVGIAGSKVGMAPWLQQTAFWLSAMLCLLGWPWITARCAFSDRIAPAPSIFIHAAPISLVSLAFMEVIVAPMSAEPTPAAVAVGHFFLIATTGGALVTLAFAYRRRAILRRFVLPRSAGFVHQEWSGLTFPLVATSTYAVLYAARIAPVAGCAAAQSAATVWATALGLLTLFVVGTIDLFYFAVGLPRWILWSGLPPVAAPPPLSDSALQHSGERECCPGWPPFGGRVPAAEVTPSAEVVRCSSVHRKGCLFGIKVIEATELATDSPQHSPEASTEASPEVTRRSDATTSRL